MRGQALSHIGGGDNPAFAKPVVCTYDQRPRPKAAIDWGEPTPESEAFWAAAKKGKVPEVDQGDQLRQARDRTPAAAEPTDRRHGRLDAHAAEIVRRYEGGESCVQLATDFHAAQTTIRALLVRNGVAIRGPGQARSTTPGPMPQPAAVVEHVPAPPPVDEVPVEESKPEPVPPSLPAELEGQPELPTDVMAWARLLADTATSDDRSLVRVLRNNVLSALAALDLVVNPPSLAVPQTPPRRPTSQPRASHVDTAEIVRRYTAGETVPTIAKALSHTPSTIRRALRRAGVEMRDDRTLHSGGAPRDYGDATVEQVRRLYVDEQLSMRDVASRLNLQYKSVVTIMTRHDIARREGQSGHLDGAASLKQRIAELGVSSNEIRAWARAGGVDCPALGVVPSRVVDLFETAHQDAPEGRQ